MRESVLRMSSKPFLMNTLIKSFFLLLFLPSLWFFNVVDFIPAWGTRKSLPVEIIIWITVTFQSEGFLSGTVCKWDLHESLETDGSTWKYPRSLKKWISFLGRKRDAAIEWTGASPHRFVRYVYTGDYLVEEPACFIQVIKVSSITFITP